MNPLRKMTPEEYAAVNLIGTERTPNRGVEGNQALVQALGDKLREIVDENATIQNQNNASAQAHIDNKSNPHTVTKAQVGLGNVDNTSDADKPISISAAQALAEKADTSYVDSTCSAVLEAANDYSAAQNAAFTYGKLEIDTKDSSTLQSAMAYTDQKVIDIGGADMQKAVYDPQGRTEDIFALIDALQTQMSVLEEDTTAPILLEITFSPELSGMPFNVTGPDDFSYHGGVPESLVATVPVTKLTTIYTVECNGIHVVATTGNYFGVYSAQFVSQPLPPMLQFFAIPGSSGKIRLKIEKPLGVPSVTIRYKTAPWTSGDDASTGTLVATIYDDSAYKGANQWYEVTGLADGVRYYFKAFSDSSSISVAGENEAQAVAGGLLGEWTFDSISGNQLTDTSGNNHHLSMLNVASVPYVVGNGGAFTNGRATIDTLPSAFKKDVLTFSLFFRSDNANQGVLTIGHNGNAGILLDHSNGNLRITECGGGNTANTLTGLPLGQDVHFAFRRGPSNMSWWINGVKTDMPRRLSALLWEGSPALAIGVKLVQSGFGNFDGTIDQLRVFNRPLEDSEVLQLYNGGAGC